MSCELCDNKKITKRWYEDGLIWVADCKTCSTNEQSIPMGVVRRHTQRITESERGKLMAVLMDVGAEVFGEKNFEIDKRQKKILTHLHWHLRKG